MCTLKMKKRRVFTAKSLVIRWVPGAIYFLEDSRKFNNKVRDPDVWPNPGLSRFEYTQCWC